MMANHKSGQEKRLYQSQSAYCNKVLIPSKERQNICRIKVVAKKVKPSVADITTGVKVAYSISQIL